MNGMNVLGINLLENERALLGEAIISYSLPVELPSEWPTTSESIADYIIKYAVPKLFPESVLEIQGFFEEENSQIHKNIKKNLLMSALLYEHIENAKIDRECYGVPIREGEQYIRNALELFSKIFKGENEIETAIFIIDGMDLSKRKTKIRSIFGRCFSSVYLESEGFQIPRLVWEVVFFILILEKINIKPMGGKFLSTPKAKKAWKYILKFLNYQRAEQEPKVKVMVAYYILEKLFNLEIHLTLSDVINELKQWEIDEYLYSELTKAFCLTGLMPNVFGRRDISLNWCTFPEKFTIFSNGVVTKGLSLIVMKDEKEPEADEEWKGKVIENSKYWEMIAMQTYDISLFAMPILDSYFRCFVKKHQAKIEWSCLENECGEFIDNLNVLQKRTNFYNFEEYILRYYEKTFGVFCNDNGKVIRERLDSKKLPDSSIQKLSASKGV